MPWNAISPAQNSLLKAANGTGGAAAFGWGPENDYVSTLNQHGVYVHASDYSKNIAALSNAHFSTHENGSPAATAPAVGAAPSSRTLKRTSDTVNHTVAFLVSDGDNMQFTMGPWGVAPTWWGAPARGTVPCGWTFPPAFAAVAPAVVSRVRMWQLLQSGAELETFVCLSSLTRASVSTCVRAPSLGQAKPHWK